MEEGALYKIPDFSKKADRKIWEQDDLTPFPAEDMSKTLPSNVYDMKHNSYK